MIWLYIIILFGGRSEERVRVPAHTDRLCVASLPSQRWTKIRYGDISCPLFPYMAIGALAPPIRLL